MAALTVWRFGDPGAARRALETLEVFQKQGAVTVQDAATVSWPPERKRPRTEQHHHLAGPLALEGAFWGLFFGLLFFVPLLGVAVGAALGALSGSLADVGIDDDFIDAVRSEVQPGTSALFVLTSQPVDERVRAAFGDGGARVIETNHSKDEEERLRGYFGSM